MNSLFWKIFVWFWVAMIAMGTAIAWTTAASVVAVIQLVRDQVLPQHGFLKQEEIPLEPFLATVTGRLFVA